MLIVTLGYKMDDQLGSAVGSRARPQVDDTFPSRSLCGCHSPGMVQGEVLCLEKVSTFPLLLIWHTTALPLED